MRFYLSLSLYLLCAFVLAACSRDEGFQAKSIAGLMPPLQFELTSDEGRRLSAADSDGKVRLMFFGYTSCPDICPLTLGRLSAVLHELPPEQREQVRVLFVSVDPRRDTVDKLHDYVGYFGEQVVGLRGEEAALRELAKRYRTTFGYGEPDPSGFYEVSHSSGVYVFDRQGRARLLFRPEDSIASMAADLQKLLSETGGNAA